MKSLGRQLFFVFYNLCYLIAFTCIKIVAAFNSNLQDHIKDRMRVCHYRKPESSKKCVLFYVSSAGEYEQALPLADRLEEKYEIMFIFFSPSGLSFARKRSEHRPIFLSPPDFPQLWNKFFRAHRVKHVFIVRHELWPNFVRVAARLSQVHLIDASMSSDSLAYKFFLRILSPYFTQICAISLYDLNTMRYLFPRTKVMLTGDTKYDRVRDRRRQGKAEIATLRKTFAKVYPGKSFLVVGSAWPKDAELILQSWQSLPKVEKEKWQVVIAPHDISSNMLKSMKKIAKENGLKSCFFKDFENMKAPENSVLLVDRIGILFELYGCAQAAFVGGALHHKIHNVLEPAVFGCHIAHGPRFKNQKEAKVLVEKGFSEVVATPKELTDWWQNLPSERNERTLAHLKSLMGATDQVVKTL